MRHCKSEDINGFVRELKNNIIMLVAQMRQSGDIGSSMDILESINGYIDDIVGEVACIESQRDREHEMASKMRKQWGAAFNKMCDEAGVE